MFKLTEKIATEEEKEFDLKCKDFLRPPLKQIKNSVSRIKYTFSKDEITILPEELPYPLDEIMHMVHRIVKECPFFDKRDEESMKTKKTNGFIFVLESFAFVLDQDDLNRPASVLCDILIALPATSLVLLTVASRQDEDKSEKIYNNSVASGLSNALKKFTTESVAPLYCVMSPTELADIEKFEISIGNMREHASLAMNTISLFMDSAKFENIAVAFWAVVAKSKALTTDFSGKGQGHIRFLTKEQCVIIVQNINKKEVTVTYKPGCGATTLMLEVAMRLERLGTTLLVCESEAKRDRLRLVHPDTIAASEIKAADLSYFTNVVDNTGSIQEVTGRLWKFSYDCPHLDRRPSVMTNATGMTGGEANQVTAIGTQYNYGQQKGTSADLEKLKVRTEHSIRTHTNNTVVIPRAKDVATMLDKHESKWLTIRGYPGEGKSTFAYMVLEEMQKKEYDVFEIDTPENFQTVSSSESDTKCVMLLNKPVGKFAFDPSAFSRWRNILEHQLSKRETTDIVLFVATHCVVEGMRSYFRKSEIDVLEQNVFDLTEEISKNQKLKMEILNRHLKNGNIKLDETIRQQICSVFATHSFPYSCKMFVDFKKKGQNIDIKELFSSPFNFLNQPMKDLMQDDKCNDLMMLLLKKEGKFDIDGIDDDRRRSQFRTIEEQLIGSYLRRDGDFTAFRDQSIYDSAALAVGRIDPLFVVKHCPTSFVMERLRINKTEETEVRGFLYFKMSTKIKEVLVERFMEELKKKNFQILQHSICSSDQFLKDLLDAYLNTNDLVIDDLDSNGTTMLHVAASNGNITAVKYLVKRGADVSLKSEGKERTVLHYVGLQEEIDVDIINLVVTKGADVNETDVHEKTVLHYICEKGKLKQNVFENLLCKHKADATIQDKRKRTPLHFLCARSDLDANIVSCFTSNNRTKIEVIDKNNRLALHYLCMNGTLSCSILDMCIDESVAVNAKDTQGRTPLHYVSERTDAVPEFVAGLIAKGAEVNVKDNMGKTALHLSCQRKTDDTALMELLISKGADTRSTDNEGFVPFKYLCDDRKPGVKLIRFLVDNMDHIDIKDGRDDPCPSHIQEKMAIKKLITGCETVEFEYSGKIMKLTIIK